jgi:hypothetical protein
MNLEEFLKNINLLIGILGNVTLAEAKDWISVEENAARLRAEGHEEAPAETPA